MFHELTHSVFHESTWHQTLCSLHKFFFCHSISNFKILFTIFIQQSPVVTHWQPFHIKPPPWWLAASLPHDILIYTLGKTVVRGGLTWVMTSIESLMPYCLKRKITQRQRWTFRLLPSCRQSPNLVISFPFSSLD